VLAGARARLDRVTIAKGAAAAALVSACLACHADSIPVAAFWYEDGALTLPRAADTGLGGPLTDHEIESIRQISRNEVEKAFAGLRIVIGETRRGFWHVAVVQDVPRRSPHPLPSSGESIPLGPLGGYGSVGFVAVTLAAMRYAPADASRQMIVEGIGRGIGRVAAHEFGHQILGPSAAHSDDDESSYEYGSPDRAAQYYGQLHWAKWRPLLQRRLGR